MKRKVLGKSLLGGLVGGGLSVGTLIAVPEGVVMPWYGYVIVGGLNASIVFAGAYIGLRSHSSPES
jgi:hypothetical protein